MNLSDFSLLKEAPDHYVVGHPKGKSIKVSKNGLSDKAHDLIQRLRSKQSFDDGGEVAEEAPAQQEAPPPEQEELPAAITENATPAPQPGQFNIPEIAGTSPSVGANAEMQASGQNGEEDIPQTQPAQAGTAPDLSGGLEEAKRTIEKGTQAQAEAGRQKQAVLNQVAQDVQNAKTPDQRLNEYKMKQAALEKSMAENEVDPNRVWHNMGTASKIGYALSALAGGIGAGLTKGPNLAVQTFNRIVDQDIQAQKAEADKKMNLWRMNRDALGDDNQASLATQNQLLTAAKTKMSAIEAGAQGPIAAQNAANAKLAIDQQIAQNEWMRSRLAGGKPASEQQHIQELQVMQQLRPDLYKDMQAKYIPGVGVSRVPVTEADRKTLTGYDSLNTAIENAKNFQKTKAGALGTFPGTAANAEANNIRSSIVLELNNLHGLNRLNENEYKSYMESVPSPGSFRTERSLTMLNSLQDQINHHKQAEMTHLGVMPFQKTNNDQVAVAWARQNPGNPQAQAILQQNGIK